MSDVCDGQMDVFEVLDDIEKHGLIRVSRNVKNAHACSDDELAEQVMQGVHLVPLWHRAPSPTDAAQAPADTVPPRAAPASPASTEGTS